uniref:Uncharacterized protein n=1 Tax=Cacopsylla melanoneura TaxID=428564 RepID=A0A8D8M5S1_9HEMI
MATSSEIEISRGISLFSRLSILEDTAAGISLFSRLSMDEDTPPAILMSSIMWGAQDTRLTRLNVMKRKILNNIVSIRRTVWPFILGGSPEVPNREHLKKSQ